MLEKREIRNKYREIRKDLNGSISSDFYNSDEYKRAEKIFTFLSFGSEINTTELIKKSLAENKEVALPYMTGKPHEMVFIKITSLDSLITNKYGIREPEYRKENIAVSDNNTLVIVPGLAFDNKFYRIGYGGGYYDKFLAENCYMSAVGVCFEKQLAERLPRDKNDIPVDIIVTEKKIRRK